MSQAQQSPDPTDSSIVRPSSSWAYDSVFADSAISMGSRTPKLTDETSLDSQPLPSSEHTISDRLSQLAAAAWATEQDLSLAHTRRRRIEKALREIEQCLDENIVSPAEPVETEHETNVSLSLSGGQELNDHLADKLDDEQLADVHRSLQETVQSMRLRQQEQRHINQLSLKKLESVAETCLVQERQLEEMIADVRHLRVENQKLGEENDVLHDRVAALESQAIQRKVAVQAMSSAVAGLEGWINSSSGPASYGGTPTKQRRGQYVVRGRGRFRGRYYIDDAEEDRTIPGPDVVTQSRELHDGVRAWLRGFRDVEEELQKVALSKQGVVDRGGVDVVSADDDWGDFETVETVPTTR